MLVFKLFLSAIINVTVLFLLLIYFSVLASFFGVHDFANSYWVIDAVIAVVIEVLLTTVGINLSKQSVAIRGLFGSNLPSETLYILYLKLYPFLHILTNINRIFIQILYLLLLPFVPFILLVYVSKVWLKI